MIDPHAFWQDLLPAGAALPGGAWPGVLPDGRQVMCPIRVLPGDGSAAVASLILNQASFAVQDALADALAARLAPYAPAVVVGVPTLGLTLADAVARRLGHGRMVALGFSRKFWYDDALSVPVTSITSPDQVKRLYLDPRMLPVLAGRRVALVDDVASTGRTAAAALALLGAAGVVPVAAGFAMLQGDGWRGLPVPVAGAFATPRLTRRGNGWLAA